MELIIKFVIFVLGCFSLINCQKLSCSYGYINSVNYVCNLAVDNPTEFDGFLQIDGDHLSNEGNSDVYAVNFAIGSVTIIPQIICTQFPNLRDIYIINNDLKEVTENSISKCTNLIQFNVENNPLEKVHPNAFKNNPQLLNVHFIETSLTTLPETLFDDNPIFYYFFCSKNFNLTLPLKIMQKPVKILYLDSANLHNLPKNAITSAEIYALDFSNNYLTKLDSTSFGNLQNLEILYIDNNQIHSIDKKIIEKATNLIYFDTRGNYCIDKYFSNFRDNREVYMNELKPCFETFESSHGKFFFIFYM